MALKTAKARQTVSKGKSASLDSWAFMEEIEAPMWVDLALEGRSNKEDWDDSWFKTMHPFHQRSFRDLVSASPLFVKVKGRVPKSARVSPSFVNSVSKRKPAQIQLNLSELNRQRNYHTRQSGEKPSSLNSNSNANEGLATPLHKPGNGNDTQACLYKSSDDTMPKTSITVSTDSGGKLKNPTDAQVSPSGDVHYQSTVSDLKDTMPRTSRLLHMLKMSSLRRSAGIHPLRVEVKDEQQPKDRKSYSKSSSSRSSIVTNRKASSIGSSIENSHKVKNESKVLKVNGQTEKSTVSPTKNNRKNSSIGSSSTAERASTEIRRMQGLGASAESGKRQEQLVRGKKCYGVAESQASRRPLQQVSNVGRCQQKRATFHQQRFNGEENTHLGADWHQKSLTIIKNTTGCEQASRLPLQQENNAGQCQQKSATFLHQRLVGKENTDLGADQHQKSLTSMKDTAGCQATRRPLQQVSNTRLCPQKSATFRPQRFPGKENAHLGTTQHQIFLTRTKNTTGCQEKPKDLAQPKRGSTLHSLEDIKKWEKNHGCSYFSLKQSEREKANREIQNSKPYYR